jgi:hypothetical protein
MVEITTEFCRNRGNLKLCHVTMITNGDLRRAGEERSEVFLKVLFLHYPAGKKPEGANILVFAGPERCHIIPNVWK